MRYIDADKLIFQLRQIQMRTKSRDLTEAIITVQLQPTADVEEVVECCDCKFSHYDKYVFAYSCKRRNYLSEYVRPTDFCSYGVKMDEPTKIEHNSLCETETFEGR